MLSVAQVAGIMAAKQTSTIIPMCHPLALKGVDISFHWEEDGNAHILNIQVQVKQKEVRVWRWKRSLLLQYVH